MSKSYKKPIVKDNIHTETKKSAAQKFRRKTKSFINKHILELEDEEAEDRLYKKSKELTNPYDINDWVSNCEDDNDCFCMRRYKRKKCMEK